EGETLGTTGHDGISRKLHKLSNKYVLNGRHTGFFMAWPEPTTIASSPNILLPWCLYFNKTKLPLGIPPYPSDPVFEPILQCQ
ncbi:hypothetical protein ACQP3F_32700, partial [Escherichia coli]